MIKDLVMVTMDAAEASSLLLEKDIVMKLCIIIPPCVAQVSRGGRDRNINNNRKNMNTSYSKQFPLPGVRLPPSDDKR